MRPRKRDCADERRIERLKALGRMADAALPPDAADTVLSLIGDELEKLGVHPTLSERIDPRATIH